jgi:hypothetical protein
MTLGSTRRREFSWTSGFGRSREAGRLSHAGRFVLAWVVLVTVGVWRESSARADLVAAYLEGYGGISSPQSADSSSTGSMPTAGTAGALGVQVGARLLVFEAYGDHTVFATGTSVSRAILGLRGAIGLGGFRLVLRGGGGVLDERGGALLGQASGVSERTGVVARGGIALERRLAPTLLGGLGIEAEAFNLSNTPSGTNPVTAIDNRVTGADIFFALHLKFEIGI